MEESIKKEEKEENAQELIKKAKEVLDRVDLHWDPKSTAIAGLGYALLAIATVIQESKKNTE
jgi:hypothetical protein